MGRRGETPPHKWFFLEVQKEDRTGSDIPIFNSIQNLAIVSRFINPLVLLIAIFFPRRRNRRLSALAKAADSSGPSCPVQQMDASLTPSNTTPALVACGLPYPPKQRGATAPVSPRPVSPVWQ